MVESKAGRQEVKNRPDRSDDDKRGEEGRATEAVHEVPNISAFIGRNMTR